MHRLNKGLDVDALKNTQHLPNISMSTANIRHLVIKFGCLTKRLAFAYKTEILSGLSFMVASHQSSSLVKNNFGRHSHLSYQILFLKMSNNYIGSTFMCKSFTWLLNTSVGIMQIYIKLLWEDGLINIRSDIINVRNHRNGIPVDTE